MSLRWNRYQERKKRSLKGEVCIFEGCKGKPVFKCPICGLNTCELHRYPHIETHNS